MKNPYTDIIAQDIAQLRARATELRESLRQGRFDRVTKEVKDTRLARKLRRELARVETAICAKRAV